MIWEWTYLDKNVSRNKFKNVLYLNLLVRDSTLWQDFG